MYINHLFLNIYHETGVMRTIGVQLVKDIWFRHQDYGYGGLQDQWQIVSVFVRHIFELEQVVLY